jgi:hypothetical protein
VHFAPRKCQRASLQFGGSFDYFHFKLVMGLPKSSLAVRERRVGTPMML